MVRINHQLMIINGYYYPLIGLLAISWGLLATFDNYEILPSGKRLHRCGEPTICIYHFPGKTMILHIFLLVYTRVPLKTYPIVKITILDAKIIIHCENYEPYNCW